MISEILLLFHMFCFPLRLGNTGSFPRPLKAEEERAYLEQFAKGDLNARKKLIEHNLRLVSHILKKYYVQTSDQDGIHYTEAGHAKMAELMEEAVRKIFGE